jgi:GDP-4-dehydro-6-deoxy-D-mannose reductase
VPDGRKTHVQGVALLATNVSEQGMAIWLVTGASGFVGRHVLAALQAQGEELADCDSRVVVLGRRCPSAWPDSQFVMADLHDASGLLRAIQRVAPDVVVHTAGKTPPAPDDELYRANFWGTMHLLYALSALRKPVRLVLSGSAAELGSVDPAALPVAETHPCDPRDAYGRSKLLATLRSLADPSQLEVMVARVFNPIGPGLPESQAFGRFAARLSEPGPDPLELSVGDLDARRDFIDVRDVARAMIALAQHGHSRHVYHVGSGESHRIGDGLDFLIRLCRRRVNIQVDPCLQNRRGPADSRADISRIIAHIGWRPRISWEQSLVDLWNHVTGRQPSSVSVRESAVRGATVNDAA